MRDWYWFVTIAAVSVIAYALARRTQPGTTAEASSSTTVKTKGTSPVITSATTLSELPKLAFEEDEEDEEVDATKVGAQLMPGVSPPAAQILYDEDAAIDEPTQQRELILVSATGQTDKGLCRKRNEDSVLVREDEGLFVVADGMGGYRGGGLASTLAVQTIEQAFEKRRFEGPAHEEIPSRASELARAIQMANYAIRAKASEDKRLEGMGTTICAARFSKNKQRLYVGHVGDSRVYCLRDGTLRQMTSDHTMRDLGIRGDAAAHLSRAVGIWPVVPVDIILGKPRPGDVYLLCSDGLTKMVSDVEIERVLKTSSPEAAVQQLISAANDHGGKDNISIVVVSVDDPSKKKRRGVSSAA